MRHLCQALIHSPPRYGLPDGLNVRRNGNQEQCWRRCRAILFRMEQSRALGENQERYRLPHIYKGLGYVPNIRSHMNQYVR